MKKIAISVAVSIIILLLAGCNKDTQSESSGEMAATELTTSEAKGSADASTQTEQPIQEETTSYDELRDHIMDSISKNGLVWYSVANGELTKETDASVTSYDETDLFEKLQNAGTVGIEVYLKGSNIEVVDDGFFTTSEGVVERYHLEMIVDISLPFTDMLNQLDEEGQRNILDAVAKSYKESFGVEIVRVRCNGEPIMTDNLNFESIVDEEVETYRASIPESVEGDACYYEESE